ncbi:MAG: DNA repair protein RecO [Gammaproteobacteria bacterium]
MTTRSRINLEPAWILHHYPYRDSSLLLEVFTRAHGRIGLVARGARSAKTRWHSQLQMLRPLLLSWSMRGELGTLTGVDTRGMARHFSGKQVLSACYLNELLMRLLTRHDPHPDLFAAYEQALYALDTAEEPALRLFEKRLLQELGYGLLLDREAESGLPVVPGAVYEYRLESGPVSCLQQEAGGLYLCGSSLLALHQDNLTEPVACREAKHLMRAALALYLGGRPLKTREVLRQLASLSRAHAGGQARAH